MSVKHRLLGQNFSATETKEGDKPSIVAQQNVVFDNEWSLKNSFALTVLNLYTKNPAIYVKQNPVIHFATNPALVPTIIPKNVNLADQK